MNSVAGIVAKGTCVGCGSCEKVCPKKAISLSYSNRGFLAPLIDDKLCIDCGVCLKTCIANNGIERFLPKRQIALKRVSDTKRKESQSGGAFALFAEKVIDDGGVVFGVVQTKENIAEYFFAKTKKQLKKLKKSKYVQARVGQAYMFVKWFLEEGRVVLFSGTPCHVAGLRLFLSFQGVDTANLLTIDLVCHGVPSPKLTLDFFKWLSVRHHLSRRLWFVYRDKRFGWHNHVSLFGDGKRVFSTTNHARLFYSHLALRESCYQCPFASIGRVSDITVGDCWGLEKWNPGFDDNRGASLLLINTARGASALAGINKADYEWAEAKLSQVMQHNLSAPTPRPNNADSFWDAYAKFGFEYAACRYCGVDVKNDEEIIQRFQLFKRLRRALSAIALRIPF